jgi:hypothetical protein
MVGKTGEKRTMATTTKTFGVAILASTAACLLTGSSLRAQPFPGMGMGNRPPPLSLTGFNPQAQALGFGANLAQRPFLNGVSTPYAAFTSNAAGIGLPATGPASAYGTMNLSGYGYSSGYANYYTDPLADTLRGMASVMNAEGTYLAQVQEANLRYEQWQLGRLDTRRKSIEQFLYERALTPTGEDLRERMERYELRIAMNNPPVNEVLSGESLNTIYKDLKLKLVQGATGQTIPLDPDILQQINLTSNSGGNLGVLKHLKDGGSLRWPLALQDEPYQEEVRRLNQRAIEAVKMGELKGLVDAAIIRDMMDGVSQLRAKLRANIKDLTPSQHIEANRFLNHFEGAMKALQQPNVLDSLGQQHVAHGKTVGDLLDFMMHKGLSFAPAISGDEGAYQALHSALVGFAGSLQGGELSKTPTNAR